MLGPLSQGNVSPKLQFWVVPLVHLTSSVFFLSLDYAFVPSSLSQAKETPCWQDAMIKELIALESNQT